MTSGLDTVDRLKTSTDRLAGLIEWVVADVIRGTAIKRTAFLLAVLLLFFNPLSTSFFGVVFHFTPPKEYPAIFWTVTLALATAAILVGALTTPRKMSLRPVSTRAIRGLIPFTGLKDDVELFAKLQREREISEILTAISDPGFEIGYISGESGSGKTSLIHAGVAPRVEICHPVVVEFSDLDPIESIRESVGPLVAQDERSASIAHLLASATRAQGKPILLVLDQFEQFFVHRTKPQDRRAFIESLKELFDARPRIQTKILISIRGDFADRLVEIQKALRYTLGANQVFRLERFQPDQAVAIFRVLAESEQIPFDESFVRQMVREELASREDGMVSAVDIQVLSWVIAGLPDSRERAFSRESVRMSGGVEGLLERYLQKSLAAVTHLQEPATKVLLTLIDLDQNARAGALTSKEISTRLEGKVSQKTLTEAIDWLTDPRVRLVISFRRNDQTIYQLVHERLIPALKRTAFIVLGESQRATEVLNKRVHEWLDNDRSRRYLLTWSEWRLISQQRSYIAWGEKRQQKEEFLHLTTARWRARAICAGCLFALAVAIIGLTYSLSGQTALTEWELRTYLSGNVSDRARSNVVSELSRRHSLLNEAIRIAESITDPSLKARALQAVASAYTQPGDSDRAEALLEQALNVTDSITDPSKKAFALLSDASAFAQAGATSRDETLLRHARKVAESITDNTNAARAIALTNVASAFAKTRDREQATTLFTQARESAEDVTEHSSKTTALQFVASALARVAIDSNDTAFLEQFHQLVNSITDPSSKAIVLQNVVWNLATALPNTGPPNTVLLEEAQEVADSIADPSLKARALQFVGSAFARAGDSNRAEVLLQQELTVTDSITDPSKKAFARQQVKLALEQADAMSKDFAAFERARREAESAPDSNMKAWTLQYLASARAQAAVADEDISLLRQARSLAETITISSYKEQALLAVVWAFVQVGTPSKNIVLLEQARGLAETITNTSVKAEALLAVGSAFARAGDSNRAEVLLEQASQMAEDVPPDEGPNRGNVLRAIAGEFAAVGRIRFARELAYEQNEDEKRALTLATILTRASSDPLFRTQVARVKTR